MFQSLLSDAPARFLTDKNSFTVPSDLARHSRRYHRSRITQRIQPSLLRTLPTLPFPTAASTALRSYLCGMARSEQSNSLRSFSCFTLLPSHVTTPTQSTPYHQVRTTVQSPQVSLRPDFRTSAEQSIPHHTTPTPFQAAVFPAFLPLGCHAANSSTRMPSHACQTPIRQTK
jgi:hypothetical protein